MKSILLVEDHADIPRLVRMTLELEDYEIHEAADAVTGLDMARSLRPHVVLLDVMMPGTIDGLGMCRELKADARTRHIPVVFLSARGSAADRQAGLDAGAAAYLVKPFSPMEMLELLGRLGAPFRATGEGS